ncbi:Eukaryotic peptide chain release factor subunit 1 [Hibiscus syriacus]|uniref:Eukaryotic peptide chain release factor subunit 1 n=1 Tax=Hibiscus syriacus TaxID=106335 RepID=A0A6A2ZU42_HIBSY|nr:Eukaryotic peptide chain release factor subunit 1 [Hibiscus syriacus]
MADGHESDRNIEIWKIKKLIKALEAARGNGTSMISLIMPPRYQISRVTKMLGDEFGTASNIKSRVNRQSVLGAITSAQQRLKLYSKVPPNGLVLYTGTIFYTEVLNELLESDDKFGFIVMDGNGTLFGTLSGNSREANVKFIQEKRSIGKYFEEISQDTGKYVFGYQLKNSSTGEVVIKHLNKEQEAKEYNFRDPFSSTDLEVVEKKPLLEWFANEYWQFGCSLEFVTNKSQEGSQFCRGKAYTNARAVVETTAARNSPKFPTHLDKGPNDKRLKCVKTELGRLH